MQKTYYIIEDDTATIDRLKELFKTHFPKYLCVGNSGDYDEAMNTILKFSPSLVFANADISLNGESIFSFANELLNYKYSLPAFVAMSASKDPAYKVIKNGFYDLLLKPISEFDLRKTLMRFQKKQVEERSTICLKSYTDYRFVNTDEILYLKADNNSTDLFMNDGRRITGYETMKYFEEILPANFIRIHHSYIINIDHVTRVHFGKLKCNIHNVTQSIPFSRTYKDNVDFLRDSLEKSSISSLN